MNLCVCLLQFGLVSGVYGSSENTIEGAIDLARSIASRSPVAVQGTKVSLNYSRDHTEKEGLEFMQIWNMVSPNCDIINCKVCQTNALLCTTL